MTDFRLVNSSLDRVKTKQHKTRYFLALSEALMFLQGSSEFKFLQVSGQFEKVYRGPLDAIFRQGVICIYIETIIQCFKSIKFIAWQRGQRREVHRKVPLSRDGCNNNVKRGGINVSSWEIYIDAPASALTTWNNFAKTFWKLQSSFSLIGSIELEIVIPTTKYILILISGLSAKNTLHNEVS